MVDSGNSLRYNSMDYFKAIDYIYCIKSPK
jgi:hypothetical protein